MTHKDSVHLACPFTQAGRRTQGSSTGLRGIWGLVIRWCLGLGHWSFSPGIWALVIGHFLVGCSSSRSLPPQQRQEAAKALFEQTTKQYHTPSAEAKGAEREQLQKQAAAGYRELLKKYPDQDYWAAQALRNLAGITASQGKLDEAAKLYASVEARYPKQEWEVLMAWKAAGDLLWENGRKEEAKKYYQQIVSRFDKPEVPQVVKTVVRGSKARLAGKDY